MLLPLSWTREPGAGSHCVWAGMTHCLHQIAVEGPCLAVTAFSQTVVVPCAANSALHKCKRVSVSLVLHVGGKKAQNDRTEQAQGPNPAVQRFTHLSFK